jgi:transcription termination factor NusB
MPAFNYFNYFTEIEEHFWRKRGAHLLVSPLDWTIVETWQKADIPLDAVLRGIDRAFESYSRSRRGASGRPLKSLAYCVDAVLESAEEAKEASFGAGPETQRAAPAPEPFSREELLRHFDEAATKLRAAAKQSSVRELSQKFGETAAAVEEMKPLLDSPAKLDLEDLERRFTVLEDKLTAAMTAATNAESMLAVRREMDRALSPYRRKMSAEQLALIERQYLQKRLFEIHHLSRLSLYYLK